MEKNYTRIAVINHSSHEVFIEDIPNNYLEKEYGGEIQDYINTTYDDAENLSWDYIIGAFYLSQGSPMAERIELGIDMED